MSHVNTSNVCASYAIVKAKGKLCVQFNDEVDSAFTFLVHRGRIAEVKYRVENESAFGLSRA